MSAAGRRRRQQGWSLVEAVVVVVLMGLMAVGVWKTMGLIERNRGGEQSRDVVQRAEHALQGLLLRDYALPRPDAAVPSPGRPNHLEGWLPVNVLGTEPPGRIRYLVDQTLVAPLAAPLYKPDPMSMLTPHSRPLLPAGGLTSRVSVNGLDVCLQLIGREKANVTASAGVRLAFGLQTRSPAGSAGAANTFVLTGSGGSTPGSMEQISTRTVGYTELVHRLGCFPALARLATEVKAVVLAGDLQDQAELNVKLHDLLVRATRESIVNATWRIVNSSIRLAVSTWNTAQATVTTATTPLGLATAAATLASFAVEAATWAAVLDFSAKSLKANKAALPLMQQARTAAETYAEQMAQQRAWHLTRANDFQNRGVMP